MDKNMIVQNPNSKPAGMVTVLATTISLFSRVLWVRSSDTANWECLHQLHQVHFTGKT